MAAGDGIRPQRCTGDETSAGYSEFGAAEFATTTAAAAHWNLEFAAGRRRAEDFGWEFRAAEYATTTTTSAWNSEFAGTR